MPPAQSLLVPIDVYQQPHSQPTCASPVTAYTARSATRQVLAPQASAPALHAHGHYWSAELFMHLLYATCTVVRVDPGLVPRHPGNDSRLSCSACHKHRIYVPTFSPFLVSCRNAMSVEYQIIMTKDQPVTRKARMQP